MTIEERAADFVRNYPEKSLKRTRLIKIYKEYKIKKKKIKITKIINRKQRQKIKKKLSESRTELLVYIRRGFRIIYLDELMITKRTIGQMDYSGVNN